MKKRFLLIALALVCAFALVACGGGSGEVDDADVADESGSASYDAAYLSWASEDWEAASEEEQYECARAYLIATAEAAAQAMEQEAKIAEPEEGQIEDSLGQLGSILESNPGMTVQDQVDLMPTAVEAAQEEAE
jgi:hypothetical protein